MLPGNKPVHEALLPLVDNLAVLGCRRSLWTWRKFTESGCRSPALQCSAAQGKGSAWNSAAQHPQPVQSVPDCRFYNICDDLPSTEGGMNTIGGLVASLRYGPASSASADMGQPV